MNAPHRSIAILAGLLALTRLPCVSPASAAPCPAGMTADGACVNPTLAHRVRNGVIAFAQPKFSYSAPARLPSEDADAPDIPVQWHEIYNLYTAPPIVSVTQGRGGHPDRP